MRRAHQKNPGDDRELKLEAMQLVIQLPKNRADALRVLSHAHHLLTDFVDPAEVSKLRVVTRHEF